jgi:hypothetical protein
MDIRNRAGFSPGELEPLRAELEALASLSDVIRWGRSQSPGAVEPPVITDVIVQDEFTHDAIVPWRGRALVFGAT